MNQGIQDVSATLTATGTTLATALQLLNAINYVGTVASGTGVGLFPTNSGTPNPGIMQIVHNAGANALSVYPPSGMKINQIVASNPHLLAPNTACAYWTVSSTQIVALLSA